MANILKLTRSNVATKGLILFYIDGATNQKSYKLHKPSELQDLGLVETSDGNVRVDITIGQINYPFDKKTLWINGIDQSGQDIDQIHETLSELFLESTGGGGGGTTDVSTPPHIIFKNVSDQFADSPTIYDEMGQQLITAIIKPTSLERINHTIAGNNFEIEMRFGVTWKTLFNILKLNGFANDNDFRLTAGKLLQSIRLIYDDFTGDKKIVIGNDNDIVPLGTPLLRTTWDEQTLGIISRSRTGDQSNETVLEVSPEKFKVSSTFKNGTLTQDLLEVSTPAGSDQNSEITIGDKATLSETIRVIHNEGGSYVEIQISDKLDNTKPFMVFDIYNSRYIMNNKVNVMPYYESNADALTGGMTEGQLYRSKATGATGNIFPICIVNP